MYVCVGGIITDKNCRDMMVGNICEWLVETVCVCVHLHNCVDDSFCEQYKNLSICIVLCEK